MVLSCLNKYFVYIRGGSLGGGLQMTCRGECLSCVARVCRHTENTRGTAVRPVDSQTDSERYQGYTQLSVWCLFFGECIWCEGEGRGGDV
jgi:hypothetical protein